MIPSGPVMVLSFRVGSLAPPGKYCLRSGKGLGLLFGVAVTGIDP